jgi:anti-sigma regulatory factor (Ser/Thr protein kinase)
MFSARIARQADIGEFLFALHGFLAQNCRNAALAQRASVVIEELVVNAFWHGGAESTGGVGVELAVETPVLRGAVWHDGAPFDPGAGADDPEVDGADAGDAATSGRGLRIVRAFTRSLFHSQGDGASVVRFEVVAP